MTDHSHFWDRCGKGFVVLLALNGLLFPLAAVWWLEGQRSPPVVDCSDLITASKRTGK